MSGSPLDEPTSSLLPLRAAVLTIGPGNPAARETYDARIRVSDLPLRIKPWPEPPNPLDLIMAKLDKLEDTITQILDFLTTPTLTIEPVRKPLSSALTTNQRRYLRYWARDGLTLQEIAVDLEVSSSSVQRSLAAAAKKLGYLTTAELRKAVTSGELQLD